MANWEVLDQEFYNVIDNLSDADWEAWERNRAQRKGMRQASLELQAKIHLERMALLQTFAKAQPFFNINVTKTDFSSIASFKLEINSQNYASAEIGEARFAMAA